MKRLAMLLILFAVPAQAWTRKPLFQVVPGSPFTGGGGGGGVSYPLLAPDGTTTAPSYSFTNATGAGMFYNTGLGYLTMVGQNGSGTDAAGGNYAVDVGRGTGTGAGGLFTVTIAPRGSASGASLNARQAVVTLNDTNSVIGGIDTHTAAGSNEFAAYDRPAGDTDAAGNIATFRAGQSTGTGAGGNLFLQISTPAAGTGSTQNALQTIFQGFGTNGDVSINPAATGAGVRGSILLSTVATGGGLKLDRTVTGAGTTGAQTIDKMAGCVNFAAAATTLVVTNAQATTTSIIMANAMTNDATCHVKDVERAAGSFTIRVTAACTAETAVCFWLTN